MTFDQRLGSGFEFAFYHTGGLAGKKHRAETGTLVIPTVF